MFTSFIIRNRESCVVFTCTCTYTCRCMVQYNKNLKHFMEKGVKNTMRNYHTKFFLDSPTSSLYRVSHCSYSVAVPSCVGCDW